jgi:hypothetical protein
VSKRGENAQTGIYCGLIPGYTAKRTAVAGEKKLDKAGVPIEDTA